MERLMMGYILEVDKLAPQATQRRRFQKCRVARPGADHLQALARVKPRADLGRGAVDGVDPVGELPR